MKKASTPSPTDLRRRSFLKLCGLLGLGGAAGAVLPVVPRAEAVLFGGGQHKVSETRLSMGSYLAITAIHPSRDEAQEAIGLAFEEVDRLSRLLSRHDQSTPLAHLNSIGTLSQAGKEITEVVARSLYYYRLSGGAFDITVKPVLDLFAERFAAGQTPSDADMDALLPRVGSRLLAVADNRTISFAQEGMGITLDGIAPGYIVDRISELMSRQGVVNHLIDASGDIRVSGSAAQGKPWTVAIQDPAKQKAYPEVVSMQSGAISTSGDYEVFYDREKLFHHIIDGRICRSPHWSTSVTVKAPTVTDSDALSTTIFVMEPDAGLRLISNLPGCSCFIIRRDGRIQHSDGWSAAC